MGARRRARRADMHGVPPSLAVGAQDQPRIKPQRWRDVTLLVDALRAVPLTPALCAHPVIARLLVAVGATTTQQSAGELFGAFAAVARTLEVDRRPQYAAARAQAVLALHDGETQDVLALLDGGVLGDFAAVGRRPAGPARGGRPATNPAQDCMALIVALEPVLRGRGSRLDWRGAAERLDLHPAARSARRLESRVRRLLTQVDDAMGRRRLPPGDDALRQIASKPPK